MKPTGVLRIDDTLLTHDGKHFDKIASLYAHVHGCYVWAHPLVHLHDRDDQTDSPVHVRLWEPVEIDALEAGLQAAGRAIRASQSTLKDTDPHTWRHDRLGLWRRHQHQPDVPKLSHRQWLFAQQLLTQFCSDHPPLHVPVTFDNWYTQPALCRVLDQT